VSLDVSIVVPASPEETWDRWSDFEAWPEWNAMCPRATMDGPLAPGTHVSLHLVHPRARGRTFLTSPSIVTVDKPRRLAWQATGPGVTMSTESTLVDDPGGTLLTVSSETSGRMSFSFRLLGLNDRTFARIYGTMLSLLASQFAAAAR
jgi:uncharacterized protein YndB with AHSA1/START domain